MPRGRANPSANRTDLQLPKLPAGTTAPDQQYGNRTAQEQSMAMLPIGGTPTPPAAAPSATPAAATPQAGGVNPALAKPWLQEGTHWLDTPSRSGLPPTAGLPAGPGPGLEQAGPLMRQYNATQVSEQGTLQTLLGGLAARPGASSLIKTLASQAGVNA